MAELEVSEAVSHDFSLDPEVHDPYRIWQQLSPEVAQGIVDFLPPNEVACTIRLLNKAAASQLSTLHNKTVLLSQPVPEHAFRHHWDRPDAARSLSPQKRRQLARLTASTGCISNLEVVFRRLGCHPTTYLLSAAASSQQPEICIWLVRQGCRFGESVMRTAAATGNAGFCRWLLRSGCPADHGALAVAAGAGHHDVCEVLLAWGCPQSAAVACAAAAGGHTELLERFLPPRKELLWPSLLSSVAVGCDLPTLQRLYGKLLPNSLGPPVSGSGTAIAAALPHGSGLLQESLLRKVRSRIITAAVSSRTPDWREKVIWLLEQGYPLTVDSWGTVAARPDCLERLEWLRDQGLELDVRMAIASANAGRVDVIMYLQEQGMRLEELGDDLACEAARWGRFQVLQLLRVAGIRINACEAVIQASLLGHSDVMMWLVKTFGSSSSNSSSSGDSGGGGGGGGNYHSVGGIGSASSGTENAAGGGDGGGNGEEEARLVREAAVAVAGVGNLELLQWLHSRGCTLSTDTFEQTAGKGSPEMLEWLVEKGCPMGDSGEAYVRAARTGDLTTLRCLHALRCPWGGGGVTFSKAIAQGCCLQTLQWLVAEGCPVRWAAAWREAKRPWRVREVEVLEWIRVQRRQARVKDCRRLMRLWLRRPAWCSRAIELAEQHLSCMGSLLMLDGECFTGGVQEK